MSSHITTIFASHGHLEQAKDAISCDAEVVVKPLKVKSVLKRLGLKEEPGAQYLATVEQTESCVIKMTRTGNTFYIITDEEGYSRISQARLHLAHEVRAMKS